MGKKKEKLVKVYIEGTLMPEISIRDTVRVPESVAKKGKEAIADHIFGQCYVSSFYDMYEDLDEKERRPGRAKPQHLLTEIAEWHWKLNSAEVDGGKLQKKSTT